jgi:hypothetical protein
MARAFGKISENSKLQGAEGQLTLFEQKSTTL